MPRKSKLSTVPVVRRKGRKLVGVCEEQYRQILKLRRTKVGDIPVSAVVGALLGIGLSHLGPTGLDVKEEE